MCQMCDGATLEEVLEGIHERVGVHGFTTQLVETEPGWGWGYTIGLRNHDQAELIIVDRPLVEVSAALHHLARRTLDGHRFEPGDVADMFDTPWSIGEVHPAHSRRNLFNMWWNYHHYIDRDDVTLVALQVSPPRTLHGEACECRPSDLARPHPVPGEMNRDASRRAARDRRHRGRRRR